MIAHGQSIRDIASATPSDHECPRQQRGAAATEDCDEEPEWRRPGKPVAALSRCAGRDVDILILNSASPIIKMQVLRYGVVIKKDNRTYSDFFVSTLREYFDLKYLRKEIEVNLLKGRTYA